MPDEARQPIPGYTLLKKLGEGGMAATYLARQASMDRLVAIKIMRRNLARDESFITRFEREAQLAGRLDHVNIVGVHDVGEAEGFHFLAMEYVEGRGAGDLVPDGGAMDEGLALHICMQVARALDYASRHDIVHRDIKPDNIMVTEDRVAKVCDFGLARHTGQEARLTQTGMAMGTPHYISPEQARGESDADARSDIYSLGATLYHFVTGEPPFSGSSAAVVMTKHISEELPWPQDVNPEISENVCRLIAKMMAKRREDRYETPAELLGDLELVIDGKAPQAEAPAAGLSSVGLKGAPVARPRTRPRRRSRRLREDAGTAGRLLDPVGRRGGMSTGTWIALAGAAVLGLLLVGWLMTRGDDGAAQRERAAGRAWQERVVPAVREELSSREALALRDALTAFGARHGETKFGRGKSDEIARLKARAEAALTGPAPAKTDRRVAEMYEMADSWSRKNPEKYAGAILRFEKVREAATGTKYEIMAQEAVDKIKAARAKAAAGLLAGLKRKADALAGSGDYDGAIALFDAPPESLAGELRSGFDAERKRLRDAAAARVGARISAAEKFSRDGQPEKGLAELDALKGVKYASSAGRIAALVARLRKESADVAGKLARRKEAEARDALEAILKGFDKLVLAGEWKPAEAHLSAEKKKLKPDVLEAMPADLAAAEKVAGLLSAWQAKSAAALKKLVEAKTQVALRTRSGGVIRGKIKEITADALKIAVRFRVGAEWGESERNVKVSELAPGELEKLLPQLEATGANGHLAAALVALSRKELVAAGKALDSAGEHVLVPRYRRRLDVLRFGQKEALARADWDRKVKPLVREKYTREGGGAVVKQLDLFEKTHAGTDCAKSKQGEIAKIRRNAGLAMGALVYTKWPFDATEAARRQQETAKALGVPAARKIGLGGAAGVNLVLIPAGEFMMGGSRPPEEIHKRGGGKHKYPHATDATLECYKREHPRHRVRISRAFYLGRCEVSQVQWKRVMGKSPSRFKGGMLPVEQVSWSECREFCDKLGKLSGAKGLVFRLPTEAEWEYACRAGTEGLYSFGEKITSERVNYNATHPWDGRKGKYRNTTIHVGSLRANPWGLRDMHGNVYEWCADWFGPYSKEKQVDPKGPATGKGRVMRSGSWYWPPGFMRSAFRDMRPPTDRDDCYGMRVAATILAPGEKGTGGPDGPGDPTNRPPEATAKVAVTGFTLVNADNGNPSKWFNPLRDGTKVKLAHFSRHRYNIRADVRGKPQSIAFWLNGKLFNVEGGAPYTLVSDRGGRLGAWKPAAGEYTLEATVSGRKGSKPVRPGEGPAGSWLKIRFEVVGK